MNTRRATPIATHPEVSLSRLAMVPEELLTSSMAASARTKMAIHADKSLAFHCLALRLPCRQHRHDGAPLLGPHPRPAGDFIDGAPASEAQTGGAVHLADVDAGSFQGRLRLSCQPIL